MLFLAGNVLVWFMMATRRLWLLSSGKTDSWMHIHYFLIITQCIDLCQQCHSVWKWLKKSHSNSKYFPMLHNTVLRSIARICEVLQGIAKYCEVMRSIARYCEVFEKYLKILQNKTFLIIFKRCAVKVINLGPSRLIAIQQVYQYIHN